MTQRTEAKQSRILVLLLLIVTATIAVFWSAHRNLNQDEAFVFQTDTVRTLHQLIDVQLHYPVALDPLFYHLLGFASVKLFGSTPFAIRLPSILGFLLMQICLYAVVRRIAGGFAGFVAAWVPAATATLFYAQQTRPYGVLLGLAALLLLAYQHSTRDTSRVGWLITLAVTLALALNTHYFAILLLIPLYTAELVRIATNRRIDWPMIAAIAAGSAGELLTLPFQPGASEFRKHYYNAGKVSLHAITQSYRSLFVDYSSSTPFAQHLLIALLVIFALALAVAFAARIRAHDLNLPVPERTFVAVLALLPFFGFLLARFVTHSIEVRYILPAIIGLAIPISIAILPLYRKASLRLPSAAICFAWLAIAGYREVKDANASRLGRTGDLSLSTAPAGDAPIYLQSMGNFDELGQFLPEPERSRISLTYSAPLEIELAQHDTQSLTAEHMRHFTSFRITRYEDLRAQPGPHLFVVYPKGSGWDWLLPQLQRDGATLTPLGPALEGELVSASFPEQYHP